MADVAIKRMQNLVSLFDNPLQPLFTIKNNKQFIVPDEYVVENQKNSVEKVKRQMKSRSSAGNIKPVAVEKLSVLPDLSEISDSIKKNDTFSLFLPKHKEIAAKLIEIFFTSEDLLSAASYAFERVNKLLFFYAYSVALLHRDDTKGIRIPNQIQQFPDLFFDKEVFTKANDQLKLTSKKDIVPIELHRNYTACDLEMEHRMAYFREDLAVNLHHWHWHLAYPNKGSFKIIKKDRRGELFYYMHQQIIARYNFDRLCNLLKRVERLSNWHSPIEEAYFPKLDSKVASRGYPSRPKNMYLNDVDAPEFNFELDISDLIRWRDRISKAIDLGYAKGQYERKVMLTEESGIDVLGNMIESSDLSINPQYYGDLHGAGHMLVSYIHDPKNYHNESLGVMGDVATAMRDPVFYRWHAYIDSIFHKYQERLKPYSPNKLDYPGVTVTGISVQTGKEEPKNTFKTHWQKATTELRGLDLIESEDKKKPTILVRYTHLQHEPFSYEISVKNDSDEEKMGTCRIFMSPSVDEAGKPWGYKHQRFMFIEMDRFKVKLQPGDNTITRQSVDTTVTIPFERTFYNFEKETMKEASDFEKQVYGYCGCGWPHHLLVPKGTAHGFESQLFVMISNYEDDKVEQTSECACKTAESGESGESFCGIRGGKYPDKRAMGFPFDRLADDKILTLQEFMAPYKNMLVEKCVIVHSNKEVNNK